MRSRTICMIFLFLSISGMMVTATAPTVEGAGAWTVGVYAKTTTGNSLSVKVTALSPFVGGTGAGASAHQYTFYTPILMQLAEGQWTFTAPMSATVNRVKYNFVSWDGEGYTVSTSNSFTYGIYSTRYFWAVYAQVQAPPTTTTQGHKPSTTTPSTSCGYIEYMMGQCQLSTATTTPVSNPYNCQTGNTVYLKVDLGGTSVQNIRVRCLY